MMMAEVWLFSSMDPWPLEYCTCMFEYSRNAACLLVTHMSFELEKISTLEPNAQKVHKRCILLLSQILFVGSRVVE